MKAWSLVLSKEVKVTKEGDHYVDQDGNLWNADELACLQEELDWQHYRIQAAVAVMQGITPEWGNNARQYAEWAVKVADALIAELQKKGGQ